MDSEREREELLTAESPLEVIVEESRIRSRERERERERERDRKT